MTALLLLVLALGSDLGDASPAESYRRGVERKDDAGLARDAFARAADGFDLASPASARAKGRALFLAGRTPQAIAALHPGLALAPYDRELQADLQTIRDSIRYPESTDPLLRVRPDALRSLRHRVSPWDLFAVVAAFGLLTALGTIKRMTTRPTWATPIAAVGALGLLIAGAIAWRLANDDAAAPLVLLHASTMRKGNGESYTSPLTEKLPRGAEVRELGRRGGWIRVELPGGSTGWLPATAFVK